MSIGARPPQTGANFARTPRCNTLGGNAMQHDPPQPSATRHGAGRDSTTRRATAQTNPVQCFLPPKKNPQGPAYPRCSPHAEGLAAPCPPQPIRCGVVLPKPPWAPTWGGCCPHVRGIKHCQGLGGIVQVGPFPITRWGTKGTATRLGCPRAPGTSATSATSGAGDVGDDDGKKRSPCSSPNTPQPPPLPFPGAA